MLKLRFPLVIHWPGKKPANIEYMTSHLDLVPTLLPEVLGCENPTEDYSVGMSIWKEAGLPELGVLQRMEQRRFC